MNAPLYDMLYLCGCVAWLTTALVKKDGPNLILRRIRYALDRLLGGQERNPLNCFTCTTFWVTLAVLVVWQSRVQGLQDIIRVFGVMGLAAAVRGLSQEF